MEFFQTLLTQPYLWNAWLAGCLASVGCGMMGGFVVVKRLSFLAGGIAHSVLAGMGIAYYIGASPLLGALICACLAAVAMGWIHVRWRQNEDTIVAAFWSVGMAVGIIFIAKTPGYNADLLGYLFGNILMVSSSHLWIMLLMDLVIVSLIYFFYKPLVAVCFDDEFARVRGIHVEFYYILMLLMVALTVVLLIQVVGLILVIALISLPAATAALYAVSFLRIMTVAVVLGLFYTSAGLALAYQPDWPVGATIILLAGLFYFVALVFSGRATHGWRKT